jgi:hypothetical protein
LRKLPAHSEEFLAFLAKEVRDVAIRSFDTHLSGKNPSQTGQYLQSQLEKWNIGKDDFLNSLVPFFVDGTLYTLLESLEFQDRFHIAVGPLDPSSIITPHPDQDGIAVELVVKDSVYSESSSERPDSISLR